MRVAHHVVQAQKVSLGSRSWYPPFLRTPFLARLQLRSEAGERHLGSSFYLIEIPVQERHSIVRCHGG